MNRTIHFNPAVYDDSYSAVVIGVSRIIIIALKNLPFTAPALRLQPRRQRAPAPVFFLVGDLPVSWFRVARGQQMI